jgi:hypothetical protein
VTSSLTVLQDEAIAALVEGAFNPFPNPITEAVAKNNQYPSKIANPIKPSPPIKALLLIK